MSSWRERNWRMLGMTQWEWLEHERNKYQMSNKKNRVLAAMPRFKGTDREAEITEIRTDLMALYDEAVEAQKREEAMGRPTVSTARFPSIRGREQ